MKSSDIKAVIFDMGGVILRTTDRGPRTKLGERFGKTYEEMDALVYGTPNAKLAGVGAIDINEHYRSTLAQFGLTMGDRQWFFDEFWGGDSKDQILVDYICQLKKKYTTALLSNAWIDARASVETQYQFLHAFDFSVFSAEIEMAKPDPKIYLWILDQIGMKAEETIFVDDFIENIEAANALGIHGIWYRSTPQVVKEIQAILG